MILFRIACRRVMPMSFALAVGACGGGGGGDLPQYSLLIQSAEVSTSYPTEGTVLLTGEGFLPPGSHCAPEPSPFNLPGPPLFDTVGPHRITWANTTTGTTGEMRLRWSCGSAPTWSARVPLAPGANHLTVTQSVLAPLVPSGSGWETSAVPAEQTAHIMVTRPNQPGG